MGKRNQSHIKFIQILRAVSLIPILMMDPLETEGGCLTWVMWRKMTKQT